MLHGEPGDRVRRLLERARYGEAGVVADLSASADDRVGRIIEGLRAIGRSRVAAPGGSIKSRDDGKTDGGMIYSKLPENLPAFRLPAAEFAKLTSKEHAGGQYADDKTEYHVLNVNATEAESTVTAKDIAHAVAEGYDSLELSKRYTTVTMGPSQGRFSQLPSARVLAAQTGMPMSEVGVTTARPP